MLAPYKCYFTGFAHGRECCPSSHLWISITVHRQAPGSAGLVELFRERRFNEGEPANGLSSIQSQQLACDGYRAGLGRAGLGG